MKFISLWSLKLAMHLLCLLPLIWLYSQAFTDSLGADPVEVVIHFTGIGAFNVLIATLLVSPLSRQLKWANLMQTRRLLGLWSCAYACFHLANFLAFELQFDFTLFISEIVKRPYITVGMLAFAIILSLAVTSPLKIRRTMGKRWQQLHNLIYPLAILIGIHFYWSVKSEIIEPLIYLAIVIALLIWRKKRIKQWLFS